MAQVRSADNKLTERALVTILRENRFSGWRRKYPLFGKPDFVFPRSKVAVFVDGCFWHGHPTKCRMPETHRAYWLTKIARNIARDRRVTRALRSKGWRVVRIWEDAIQKPSTVKRLRNALS